MWDLATGSCAHTLSHHADKVQAVAWNPAQPSVLLSGGFDQRACLVRVSRTSHALHGTVHMVFFPV